MGYRFKRYFTVKRIAYTALFAALAVIANSFTVYLPFMGASSNAVSFTYLVCALAGAFLGPVCGGLVGGIGDLLGWLINSSGGAFNIFITLGSILLGVIPGLVHKIPKLPAIVKILIAYAIVFVVCMCGVNTFGIWFYYIRGAKTYFVYLAGRIATQSIIMAINIVLTCLMYYPLRKYVFKKDILTGTGRAAAPLAAAGTPHDAADAGAGESDGKAFADSDPDQD